MNKKILITGYSGFVGSNLVKSLQPKYKLLALSRNIENKPDRLDEVFSWNNLSAGQLAQTGCIIHLAGKAHDLKNTSSADEYFKINTELTKSLFDLFLKSDAEDFIYFSSVKAVADRVEGVLDETAVPEPKTPYGQSKQQAEEYLLRATLPAGKRLFILRPCMIHGRGNKGNLNLLYKFVTKGIPYPLGAFDNRRSFLCIDNLNYIVEKIISNKSIPGGVYNMADDEPLPTNEVIKIIAHASGTRAKLWKISPGLIRFMARTGDLLHLPLNSERLKKLTESYVVSNQKIKKVFGITYLPVSSTDGLTQTVVSFGH